MYSTFRAIQDFGWSGWQFSPNPDGPCECNCSMTLGLTLTKCTGVPNSGCQCRTSPAVACWCACRQPSGRSAGDVWIVEERHPNIDSMTWGQLVVYDSSIGLYPSYKVECDLARFTEPLRGISVVRQPVYRNR